MAMIKIISPSGWDWDRPVCVPIKISTRGLIGNDRSDFLKVASHTFLDVIDNIKVAKDELPIHVIALGSHEFWGPNRNGDTFLEKTCKDRHHTFVKYARWFRNHKNRPDDGDPHYGIIKESAYNDQMHRVELLGLLFQEKSAAERYNLGNGKVADKEIEKIAKGENLPTSMACRVNYDECGFCGHKATKRDDYCTAKTCKAGGCKDNLTRLIKVGNDVHHMHVRNPMATWFDMSLVFRPACRTSYAGKADYLTKMAEDMSQWGHGVGGAKLAEDMGVTAPWSVLQDDYHGLPVNRHVPGIAEQLKLAEALVAYESRPQLHFGPDVKRAFDARVQTTVDTALLGEPGTEKCAMALAALADQKIVLGLRDFASMVKKAELTAQAASRLPGVYTRMYRDGELEPRITNNAFPLSTKTADYKQRQWAARNKGHLSLEKQAVDYRMRLSSVRCYTVPALITGYVKEGADAEAAEELARDYAIYKVAALHHIASFDDDFATTCRIAMSQNCVS